MAQQHGEMKAEKIDAASFSEEATGVWRGPEAAGGLCSETGNAPCQAANFQMT